MQALKQELEKLFDESFFPVSYLDIMNYLDSYEVSTAPVSKELYTMCANLEQDPNFKYNSIDDILPMPSLVEYPFYTESCDAFFCKILSKDKEIYVYTAGEISSNMCEQNVIYHSKFNPSTKERFEQKFNEVFSLIKSDI